MVSPSNHDTVQELLRSSPIDRLDAEILLSFVVQKDRSWLLGHTDLVLDKQQRAQYQTLEKRRLSGEPIAYITGIREFYGRDFIATPDVLIPRPSTEVLIDETLRFLESPSDREVEADTDVIVACRNFQKLIAHTSTMLSTGSAQLIAIDIGTGSGCIAVTLALENPHLRMIAIDISEEALDVAKKNAQKHNVADRIEFLQGDLLAPVEKLDTPFVVISNPPYIPDDEKLEKTVRDFEPHAALFAGEDGGDTVRKLYAQAKSHPKCYGIVFECRSDHRDKLSSFNAVHLDC